MGEYFSGWDTDLYETNEEIINDNYFFLKSNYNKKNIFGNTLLMKACTTNNLYIVNHLLNIKSDVNMKNKSKNTALFGTSKNGNEKILERLFMENVNCNSINVFKQTSLMAACHNGHINIVNLLLENNVNCNSQDNKGRTALMNASSCGNYDVIENLEKTNYYYIFQNQNKYINIINLLLINNIQCNLQDDNGYTALMVASILGYEKIVKRLLEYKNNGSFCDYNLTDNNENTALLLASEHVNIKVFDILFKHNVNEIKKSIKLFTKYGFKKNIPTVIVNIIINYVI